MDNTFNTDFYIFSTFSLELFGALFFILLLILSVGYVVMYLIDVNQTKHTLRRNYPVIARFRYTLEHLGKFFRQYIISSDRSELPFNRAQRSWVYQNAKNVESNFAFGSSKDITKTGNITFINSAYPVLEEEEQPNKPIVIGEDCEQPYMVSGIFHISGMSFGAISKPAVQALSRGAKLAGIWLNTGEGGLSEYHLEGGCDLVFQIGTAKYGVRNNDGSLSYSKLEELSKHQQIRMFELKLSQGAKPGKGGILPGKKVTEEIAKIRLIPAGQDSISPNRHLEVYDDASLLRLIHKIRQVTGKPVGFKMALADLTWFEEFCKLVAQDTTQAPDFITLDSADGGTGAAPMGLMDNVSRSIEEVLPQVINLLRKYKLKDRIKIIASGKLITAAEVAWAIAVGADFVVSARGFMFALGCIQSLHCNKNNCPTGITTHDKKLQRGLSPDDKSVRVANYAFGVERGVRYIANACGVKELRDLNREHIMVRDGTKNIKGDKFYQS